MGLKKAFHLAFKDQFFWLLLGKFFEVLEAWEGGYIGSFLRLLRSLEEIQSFSLLHLGIWELDMLHKTFLCSQLPLLLAFYNRYYSHQKKSDSPQESVFFDFLH